MPSEVISIKMTFFIKRFVKHLKCTENVEVSNRNVHGIQWNTMEYNGIQWNPMESNGIQLLLSK